MINIQEHLDHYQVAGVSIAHIHNRQIQLENYGLLEANDGKYVDDNTLFNACSISKFLTSMLVVTMAEKELVDIDEDVNKKLSSWKVPTNSWAKRPVTIRNLLSHQSGIIDPEGSFSPLNSNDNDNVSSMVKLLEGKTEYCNQAIEMKYEPESEFHYSDAGFCIIEQLLEDLTGKTFVELMQENVFKPLDMRNSTYKMNASDMNSETDASGHSKKGEVVKGSYPLYPYPSASGLWTTPSDLAIVVVELMNALHGESKLGLSANAAKEMISAQSGKGWSPYAGHGLVVMTNTDLGIHQLKGIIGEVYQAYSLRGKKNDF